MSAADAPGKNVTIGAGVPRIPCTRPAVCSTPAHAYSRRASNTRSSTCSPAIATSHSRSPGAPTRTSPGAYRDPSKIRGKALMQAENNTLTSTRAPRSLTKLMTLGRTLKRQAGDTPGLLRPPPHHRQPHRSHQRPPRTPTRIRTRTCETSPTTPPEHSTKQEESDPNYTPNYEEPLILMPGGIGRVKLSDQRIAFPAHQESGAHPRDGFQINDPNPLAADCFT